MVLTICAGSAWAQTTVFSYEPGEAGMPYHGNPGTYVVGTSTTVGVTHGTQSLSVTSNLITFGGPQSSLFSDNGRAFLFNGATDVLIDMTVPQNVTFGFGNIDLTFFQTGMRGGAGFDETRFSPTFATAAPGSTITLDIPLTNTQFGSPRIVLDGSQPWAYQIDLSYNTGSSPPFTFNFDNLRLVPEPASAGMLCLLSGTLLGKRRQRH